MKTEYLGDIVDQRGRRHRVEVHIGYGIVCQGVATTNGNAAVLFSCWPTGATFEPRRMKEYREKYGIEYGQTEDDKAIRGEA